MAGQSHLSATKGTATNCLQWAIGVHVSLMGSQCVPKCHIVWHSLCHKKCLCGFWKLSIPPLRWETYLPHAPTYSLKLPAKGNKMVTWLLGDFFVLGSDQDELASPAHFTILEITSRNQDSELSSATMIPQWCGRGSDTRLLGYFWYLYKTKFREGLLARPSKSSPCHKPTVR